ncbi:MAG TPA: hypothetical protein VJT15_15235 [Pyrinomonadaceae bacterium]|nr:hypothetical protein [Pyrinomonadaceae bacterium]
MLAYVFWHWPQPGVGIETYVEHLVGFHRTLAENKPVGFRGSRVFRFHGASWLETKGDAFEDWYLVDDSAALDRINEDAVTGPCEAPHNLVAREAAGGTAGLYRLRRGEIFDDVRYALWLAKPDRMSYADFYAALDPIVADAALWGRQMTLGPTTEFVLHSANPIQLPDSLTANQVLALQSVGSDPKQP